MFRDGKDADKQQYSYYHSQHHYYLGKRSRSLINVLSHCSYYVYAAFHNTVPYTGISILDVLVDL